MSLVICDDTLVSASASGRLIQANLSAAVGAAASAALAARVAAPLYTQSLHGHFQGDGGDAGAGVGGLSGGGGGGGVDGGGGAGTTVGVHHNHHHYAANQMRVPTERVRNAKGLKEKGPISSLVVLSESRLLAVTYEDGFVRLCF